MIFVCFKVNFSLSRILSESKECLTHSLALNRYTIQNYWSCQYNKFIDDFFIFLGLDSVFRLCQGSTLLTFEKHRHTSGNNKTINTQSQKTFLGISLKNSDSGHLCFLMKMFLVSQQDVDITTQWILEGHERT